MNISKFFIDRPVFAGVLSVLILISGLLALGVLPISEYPEVVPPQVVVRANYPGASPKIIAETVATPIEGHRLCDGEMVDMAAMAAETFIAIPAADDPRRINEIIYELSAQAGFAPTFGQPVQQMHTTPPYRWSAPGWGSRSFPAGCGTPGRTTSPTGRWSRVRTMCC